ncbi:hypothetical protein BOX15_Mlig018197g2 [Macrostomum lignano]|uniref:Uncharacterized protein n=2 Tax=Macrostomum lignano TaxID=282301 RepID=A0A267DRF1_9PLAT|nr:hypothetical protein BOX15_Mlig018197g2 [Macrostomum lignano]
MSNCSSGTFLCQNASSLILPLLDESTWRNEVRAALYLVGLFWSFMGVSIVADVFMTSIERITSATRKMTFFNSDTGVDEQVDVKIWNDTVANLSLMALGSSAPEILLSIIEIIGNGFKAGELGPGTIVGSAAFNLLIITAVCICSVDDEGKRIKQFMVFCVTATFSEFAYIWLVIILVCSSPDFIDLWEGVVTFLLFFILVVAAYIMDKGFCFKKAETEADKEANKGLIVHDAHHINEEKLREFIKQIGKDPNLTEEEVRRLALKKFSEGMPHSRAWYRINATRQMMGGHKLQVQLPEKLQGKLAEIEGAGDGASSDPHLKAKQDALTENGRLSVVEFTSTSVAVLERDQRARLTIRRYGNVKQRVVVKAETVDGTATKNEDYVPLKKTVVFEPDETQQTVDVEIIDDNQWEPDETFFVKLTLEKDQKLARLGPKKINQVTIINDDEPGTFEFVNASYLFKESCGRATVPVRRVNGADGVAKVSWKTEDQTARAGCDYEASSGELIFNHGEIEKTIEVAIYDDQNKEKDEHFKLLLTECSEGAKLGQTSATIITIVDDDEFNGFISRLAHTANVDLDAIRVDRNTYADQFRQAMNVNGGDIENATAIDYVMHFFTFGWKIIFAVIPPPSIWGGWLCFFVSLAMIGMLTAIIGDLASIFGCLVGLKDSVTAITFVALGTSLPDLFASKQAATADDSADNAVGNVTGSNSVNVFLGLGLPWMIAAIYHTAKGGSFNVPAGDLVFSVILYTVCSMLAIVLLILRRFVKPFGCSELGGNRTLKFVSGGFLCTLWLFYIVMSALKAYGVIVANF